MATADWPENWPEDCTSESPNNQEADEEEDESYSLTHDTESRPTESKEAPKHPGMPELESIPSHVEMDSLQRSVGSFSPLPAQTQSQWLDVPDIVEDQNGVQYSGYESEEQLADIIQLMKADLSEPYSVYTYRYFIHQWPHLCMLAHCEKRCVGAIVCKLDKHRGTVQRGYIAMLAVDKDFRKKKIGSNLAKKAIFQMIRSKEGCDEVVLEAEVTNKAALGLYANLGFVRDKYLHRYYLNGADAYRLKLWLTEKSLQY